MKYLLIFEDGTMIQQDEVTESDITSVEAGILDICLLQADGAFYQMANDGSLHKVATEI